MEAISTHTKVLLNFQAGILFIFLFPLTSYLKGEWATRLFDVTFLTLWRNYKLNQFLGFLIEIVTKASHIVGFFLLWTVLLDLRSLKWLPLRKRTLCIIKDLVYSILEKDIGE